VALLEIDETVFRDERFAALGELTRKGKFDARGRVEALWYDCIKNTQEVRTAEEVDNLCGWFDSDIGFFAELMVKARLAERVDGGFRVRGIKKRMTWLLELREGASKGGKARAAGAERDEKGRLKKAQRKAGKTQPSAGESPGASSGVQRSLPSSPFPLPSSPTTQPSFEIPSTAQAPLDERLDSRPKPKPKPETKTASTREAYSAAYLERHKTKPIWNATTNSQLAQFVRRIGEEEAPLVAAFFLTHNDAFYTRALHPVSLLLRDAEKLRTEWATGRRMTSITARTQEQGDFHREQMARLTREDTP
jgi:hypothetical protein